MHPENKYNIGFEALISHRFRGFAPYENSLAGLKSALDFGVQLLEFDVRMAKCGTPIIYHDEYAQGKSGNTRLLAEIPARAYKKTGGRFGYMPTLDALFSTITHHKNKTARFMIDIKDLGFEAEINSLVNFYRLGLRVIYVSWVPEVLYRINRLAPDIPLVFSHWCGEVSLPVAAKHKVFISDNGQIPRENEDYILGRRSGWRLKQPLKGDLLKIIKSSGGGVCVPMDQINKSVSDYYHLHNLSVSAFSYIDWPTINSHKNRFNIDMYFIDKKQVFEEI